MDREGARKDRDERGRFAPGNASKGGRPKGVTGEEFARALLGERSPELVKGFLEGQSDEIRFRCFAFLWDHAFGKARQREEIAFDRNAINVILRLARPGDPSPEDEPGSIADARRPALNPVDRDGD